MVVALEPEMTSTEFKTLRKKDRYICLCLAFIKVSLGPHIVCANSEASGKTVHMRKLC